MFTVRGVRVVALGAAALLLAACGGGGGDDADGDGPEPIADGETVKIISRDNFTFIPSDPTAKAGDVRIVHENDGSQTHSLVIQGELRLVDDADDTITLAAGDYTFYCDVPGHRDAGMEGVLTVTP